MSQLSEKELSTLKDLLSEEDLCDAVVDIEE